MADNKVFIGSYTKGEGNGLFYGNFDNKSGKLSILGNLDLENPAYLTVKNEILYGVSETNVFRGENGGALFSADFSEGITEGLKLLDIKASHGKSPCHLCITDNCIFVSNYNEGSLSIFRLNGKGLIEDSYQSLTHFGSSIREDRQKESHVHFAAISPDGSYLGLCDLGMDKVFFYPYSKEKGISTEAKIISCPPGSGPRHFVFSLCGNYLYVLTELKSTILCYEYKNGDFIFLNEVSILPQDYKGKSTAAAIHLSPCGNYLAASNRGHDSIAVFKKEKDGALTHLCHVMTGKTPRDFRFSPCGKWLLSANQGSDTVSIFSFENEVFTKKDEIEVPKPSCIVFA